MVKELLRQFAHLLVGLIAGLGLYLEFFDYKTFIVILVCVALASAIIFFAHHKGMRKYVLTLVQREEKIPLQGVLTFFFGITLAAVLFESSASSLGIIAFSIIDSLATIVGVNLPTKALRIGRKSVIASFIASLASTAVLLIFLDNFFIALAASITLSIVEMFTPLDDNIVLPVVGGLLFSII
ncbi:MAG: hypothetical protein H6502_00575 [Candidatus Woesearchaeota archaeon]|nr:MAG: hypothetical protein H6502_00575 [Candidatus Woesearchaeota archaeon]